MLLSKVTSKKNKKLTEERRKQKVRKIYARQML